MSCLWSERGNYGYASLFPLRGDLVEYHSPPVCFNRQQETALLSGVPPQDTQEHALIERIVQEQGVALLASDHLIQPTFGLRWDEGIILCSGLTAT